MREPDSTIISGLSVIIPAYDAASWLVPTISKIEAAFANTSILKSEIIIINDGSTDNTQEIAETIQKTSSAKISLINQDNKGRYLARKAGVLAARYDSILFLDTRVWPDEDALNFLVEQLQGHPDRRVWNGHVNVHKEKNVIARFGDAITFIGWRRYFANPKLTSYSMADFDHYPKGTGFFFVPKKTILEAMQWFEGETKDLRNSSDDTLLIRHIASMNRIWLSPEFSCTYFARTTLQGFLKHSFSRGQFFVDGFLRKGTRFFYPLLAFLISTVAIVILVLLFPELLLPLIAILGVLWLGELVVALVLGVQIKDAASLFLLTPLFAIVYGLGIWKATIRRILI